MAANTIDPSFLESGKAPVQAELLVSAVLHLMSQYGVNDHDAKGCTKLASVIERHLKALADLPDLAPVLQATCRQLSEQWGEVVERAVRPAEKQNLFLRLLTGVERERDDAERRADARFKS